MIGAMSGWVLSWIVLAVVREVVGGFLAARVLAARHSAEPQIGAGDSPAVRQP